MPKMDGYNRCIEFEYSDTDGVLTRRKVNAHSFYRPTTQANWFIDGFCHLRREQRTFRTDRMRRLWDGRGGWVDVGDPTAWADSLWHASAEGQADLARLRAREQRWQEMQRYYAEQDAKAKIDEEARSIINQHFHALRALLYVAKADRTFRAAERNLFVLFFKRVAGHRMDSESLEARCLHMVQRLDTPTTGQFYFSVRQLVNGVRRYRMAVCATAKAMINSDKRAVPYELEVLEYLTRKLRPLEE